jgi:hypothetical protein
MVSKPTGRPRGRPRKERPPPPTRQEKFACKFLEDPDRFGVAMLDAMLALEMGTERDCALAIAAVLVGVERDASRISGDMVSTNWEKGLTKPGATAGTLEGRASTLRVKQGRFRSAAEVMWRKHMASVFMLALGAQDRDDFGRAIRILQRMIDAKFSGSLPPEFSAKNVSSADT